MNKTAIKNFAIWARVNLIEAAKQKAYEYEITKDGENIKSLETVGGRLLTAAEKEQRRALIDEINEKGFDQVMEEAAYTWFNRFIALRYMEVNGYLPSRVRVFTNEDGEFKPEIMKEAMTVEIDGLDREKVFDLLDKQNNEELYKYLLITQCNALGEGLPKMFEKISDWTELLFPANLLRADGVIGRMVTDIPEEDWEDAVQIIGWLYQFYNTEPKAAILANDAKITKDNIPVVTQIFTPDWIVRYMVENSLGRLYISDQLSVVSGQSEAERREAEKAIAEQMGWKYYLPEAEQDPEVRNQLSSLNSERYSLTDLKLIDPCVGSGHILVYAFDVLMQMYTASGWSERDAAKSIVKNNLYGLDIDNRAGQLAYFAVMMKARRYNRRALADGASGILPNVYAIQESNPISRFAVEDFCHGNAKALEEMDKLLRQMKDAKEYGSILNIKDIDFELLLAICDASIDRITLHSNEINEDIIPLIKVAYIISQKYDVVVTNPPYVGRRNLEGKVCEYLDTKYPNSKMDLFTAFIERNINFSKPNGYTAYMTPFVWLYLSSFISLRKLLLKSACIYTYLQPEESSFKEAAVSICAFVLRKIACNYKGIYTKLSTVRDENMQENTYLQSVKEVKSPYKYEFNMSDFERIPDNRFVFWMTDKLIDTFKTAIPFEDVAKPRQGMATSNNDRFLRFWHEISNQRIGFGFSSTEAAEISRLKWFPYNKGGGFRKWYGNNYYVLNYEKDGYEVKQFAAKLYKSYSRTIKNIQFYFKKCITWSDICGSSFAARACDEGFVFDVKGSSAFVAPGYYDYILALLNSTLSVELLNMLNPSITTQVGDLKQVPFIFDETKNKDISILARQSVLSSKKDWDSFETSWDFKKHPLV